MAGFKLGRVLGIEVRAHPSAIAIVLLIMWLLAGVALPADFPQIGAVPRFVAAGAITALFFLSLLAHELAHSVVAVRRGIPVYGITFFLFGGVAHTARESRSPWEEFVIAVAGPLVSFALAAAFIALWWGGATVALGGLTAGVVAYVGALNLVLAVFNLLPGFPMDGGRVLRSLLWAWTGDLTLATRWASRVGVTLALLLVGYGGWRVIRADLMGGIWLILIGLFIRNAARTSYQQHLLSRVEEEMPRAPYPLGTAVPPERIDR
jgi:Zn-dependent protease